MSPRPNSRSIRTAASTATPIRCSPSSIRAPRPGPSSAASRSAAWCALRFAARHPERVSALVLASTPGPGWHLRPRHDLYARWPRVFGPLFIAETPFRARPELRAALPDAAARRRSPDRSCGRYVGAGLAAADGATREAHRHLRCRDRLRADLGADAGRHRRARSRSCRRRRRLVALRAADRGSAPFRAEPNGSPGHADAAGSVRGASRGNSFSRRARLRPGEAAGAAKLTAERRGSSESNRVA